ncbi:nitroreductase family protein [Candidatus Pristimantibacillus sp. PTI5]|uniref:nitroreductase family protein n=1 Tax=Candidatus Pristimantibacillus sp. PTI5 TaxID=3400422 RepID=UPI003B014FFE
MVNLIEGKSQRKTQYQVDELFLNRWSSRAFQEKPVPEELLNRILESACWAPSGNNLQPWRFIVADTKEKLAQFHSFIVPRNMVWCTKAPMLILILSRKTNEQGDPIRSHSFDAGAAWGTLAIAAAQKGLNTRAMGGFDAAAARSVLHIPEEYDLHCVVALGYRAPVDELPEELREREIPTGRRALSDVIVDFQK